MNNNFGGFKLQVSGQCRLHVGAGWSKLQVAGQFGFRPSVLRHVMYTIVDRYDNERETWSKSDDTLSLGKFSETNFYIIMKQVSFVS